MTLTFTLNSMFLGTAAGPFDIYRVLSGQTVPEILTNGTVTATGITLNQLTTGYTITNVSDYIINGYVESTGQCSTRAYWTAPGQVLPYTVYTVIGFSGLDAEHALNSIGVIPTRFVYLRTSDTFFYNEPDFQTTISGWYVFNGTPDIASEFINGVEQIP